MERTQSSAKRSLINLLVRISSRRLQTPPPDPEELRDEYEELRVAATRRLNVLQNEKAVLDEDNVMRFADTTAMSNLIDDAAQIFGRDEFEAAVKTLRTHPTVEQSIRSGAQATARNFQQQKQQYERNLPRCEQLGRILSTLRIPGHDDDPIDRPLLNKIQAARDAAALQTAFPLNYANALVLLNECAGIFSTQKNAAKARSKADLDEARWKDVYLDKKVRVSEELDHYKQMPGTAEQRREIAEKIVAADRLAGQGKYKEAYQAMFLTGFFANLRNKAVKANKKFVRELNPTFKSQYETALSELDRYRQLSNVRDAAGIDREAKAIDALLRGLEGNPSERKIQASTQTMRELGRRLKGEADRLTTHKDRCDGLLGDIRPLIETNLRAAAEVDVYQVFLSRLRATRAMYGAQQYAEAEIEMRQLKADAQQAHREIRPIYLDWDTKKKQVEAKLDMLTDADENCTEGTISRTAGGLRGKFNDALQIADSTHDFAQSRTLIEEVIAGIPQLEEYLRKYELVKDDLGEANDSYNKRREEIVDAINRLKERDGDPSAFERSLASFRSAWRDETDKVLFDLDLTDLVNSMNELADDIVERIEAILSDETGAALERNNADCANRENFEKYGSIRRAAENAIRTYEDHNQEAARVLRGQLDNIPKELDVTDGPDVVNPLVDQLRLLKQQADTAVAEQVRKATTKAQQAAELSKRMHKDLKSAAKKFPKYKAYLAELGDQVNDALAMTEGTVLRIVEAGQVKLAQVSATIHTLMENVDSSEDGVKNFKAVDKKIKQIKDKIGGNKPLKDCLPSKKEILSYRIAKEIPAECHKLSPARALDTTLSDFESEVDELIVAAGEAQTKRNQLAQTASRLKSKLSEMPENSSKLKKSLEARIESNKTPGEGGEDLAKVELDRIEAIINDVKANPTVCAALEQKARQDIFREKQAQQQWKATLDVFKKNALAQAKSKHDETPSEDVNKTHYKRITDLQDRAEKAANKQKNYAEAERLLAEASFAAQEFIDNPMGSQATARKELGKLRDVWKRAVGKFLSDVAQLKQSILTEAQDEEAVDGNAAVATLTTLTSTLDPNLFDDTVTTLMDKTKPLPSRRTAKEQGLRLVRRYQSLFGTDPVFKHLAGNPFCAVGTRFIMDKLTDWDTNLKRAC